MLLSLSACHPTPNTIQVKDEFRVRAFALDVVSAGDMTSGQLTEVACGKVLFVLELKPPSRKFQKKMKDLSEKVVKAKKSESCAQPASYESSRPDASGENGGEHTEEDMDGEDDTDLQAGLDDLLELAAEQMDDKRSDENRENSTTTENFGEDDHFDLSNIADDPDLAFFAVQSSVSETFPSNFRTAADDLEGELPDFIDKDLQEQKPAIDAEDKALNKAVSEGLTCNPSSGLASLAAEIQESEDVLAEEAVKEAALNVTSLNGTVEFEASAFTTTELNVSAPNPGLDPDLLAALSQQWLESVQDSVNCLHAQTQAQSRDAPGGRDAGVSIVELQASEQEGPRVVLVTWTLPGKTGRIVDLDKDGCLIPVVCVGAKRYPTDFQALNSKVLVPATGVNYTRDRRVGRLGVRNVLPPVWKRFLDIWMAAVSRNFDSDSLASSSSGLPTTCDICNKVEVQQEEAEDASIKCPLCLFEMHSSCGHRLRDACRIQLVDIPVPIGFHLPSELHGSRTLCCQCSVLSDVPPCPSYSIWFSYVFCTMRNAFVSWSQSLKPCCDENMLRTCSCSCCRILCAACQYWASSRGLIPRSEPCPQCCT